MLNSIAPLNSIENIRNRRSGLPGGGDGGAVGDALLDPAIQQFLQRAPRIQTAADLAADPASMRFVQKALAIEPDPRTTARAQAELVSAMLNLHEFQIPSKLQKFIELYMARSGALQQPVDAQPTDRVGPFLPGPASHVSSEVMAQLQNLRIGG